VGAFRVIVFAPWVMERLLVKTDKDSGIVNDANHYANETFGNPRYPMELFQRVITMSLERMKIVNWLPGLDIDLSRAEHLRAGFDPDKLATRRQEAL
jgi:hypothetical protein